MFGKQAFSQETWKELMKDFLPDLKIFLAPILVLGVLLSVAFFDWQIKHSLKKEVLTKSETFLPKAFPILQSSLGVQTGVATSSGQIDTKLSGLSAKSAVVLDDETKIILFGKNESLRFAPASTTKIMTALVALDFFSSEDLLTVQDARAEGTVIGLRIGEQLTFESLLYAMLLPSANDAAFAIAQNYTGGEKAFVAAMNKKAQDLHLINTYFADPAGLVDDENYTTAIDLAHLASVALKNKVISEIVGTKEKTISDATGKNVYFLENLNKLLGVSGVYGVKTGFTEGAGGVLITAQNINGRSIIVVVMQSQDRFADTRILLDKISAHITYQSIHP